MTYAEKKAEMKEKYFKAIVAIEAANGVDSGIAFDMLKNHAAGNPCKFVNEEELAKDYNELLELAKGEIGQ